MIRVIRNSVFYLVFLLITAGIICLLPVAGVNPSFALDADDVDAPSISLNIADGASVSSGDVIDIEATAHSKVGVTEMSLSINGRTVVSTSGTRLSYRWDTSKLTTGEYKLYFRARDELTEQTGTRNISVYVYSAPATINMRGPANGAHYKIGETVPVSAMANGVAYVSFFARSEKTDEEKNIARRLLDNYSAEWSTRGFEPGKYKIRAVGYSTDNKELIDDEVSVVLEELKAPEIKEVIITPTEGYEGGTYRIEVKVNNLPQSLKCIVSNDPELKNKRTFDFDMSNKKDNGDGSYTYTLEKAVGLPGAAPDYKKYIKIDAANLAGSNVDGKIYPVVVKPQGAVPLVVGVEVTPQEGLDQDFYNISIKVKNQPTSMYLQFDIPSGWMDEADYKKYFSFQDSEVTENEDGTCTYAKKIKVGTPGAAPDYLRYFRVIATNETGVNDTEKTYSFVVRPHVTPEILGVTVEPDKDEVAGGKYKFMVTAKNSPQYIYLKFRTPEGEMLDDKYSKRNFSFPIISKKDNEDGSATYTMIKKIGSPGLEPDFKRYFVVCAGNSGGICRDETEYSFTVRPEEPADTTTATVNTAPKNNGGGNGELHLTEPEL